MKYYHIEPEVAGELGKNTILNTDTHPPLVSVLNYEFKGWQGGQLLESFPCFIATKHLSELLLQNNLSGFSIDSVEITKSEQFNQMYLDVILPEFVWLKINGKAGSDDFGISESKKMLVVSETTLNIIQPLCSKDLTVSDFAN